MSLDWGSILTFASGGVGTQLVRSAAQSLRARRRRRRPTPIESRHDQLSITQRELRVSETQLEMARDVNKMLTASLSALQSQVAALVERVDALETKLRASDDEQSRLKMLLRHAVGVLRDFLEVAAEHNIPAPEMSDDLKAEIERS